MCHLQPRFYLKRGYRSCIWGLGCIFENAALGPRRGLQRYCIGCVWKRGLKTQLQPLAAFFIGYSCVLQMRLQPFFFVVRVPSLCMISLQLMNIGAKKLVPLQSRYLSLSWKKWHCKILSGLRDFAHTSLTKNNLEV